METTLIRGAGRREVMEDLESYQTTYKQRRNFWERMSVNTGKRRDDPFYVTIAAVKSTNNYAKSLQDKYNRNEQDEERPPKLYPAPDTCVLIEKSVDAIQLQDNKDQAVPDKEPWSSLQYSRDSHSQDNTLEPDSDHDYSLVADDSDKDDQTEKTEGKIDPILPTDEEPIHRNIAELFARDEERTTQPADLIYQGTSRIFTRFNHGSFRSKRTGGIYERIEDVLPDQRSEVEDELSDTDAASISESDQDDLPVFDPEIEVKLGDNEEDIVPFPSEVRGHKDSIPSPSEVRGHKDSIPSPSEVRGHKDSVLSLSVVRGHKDSVLSLSEVRGHKDSVLSLSVVRGHKDSVLSLSVVRGHKDSVPSPSEVRGHKDQENETKREQLYARAVQGTGRPPGRQGGTGGVQMRIKSRPGEGGRRNRSQALRGSALERRLPPPPPGRERPSSVPSHLHLGVDKNGRRVKEDPPSRRVSARDLPLPALPSPPAQPCENTEDVTSGEDSSTYDTLQHLRRPGTGPGAGREDRSGGGPGVGMGRGPGREDWRNLLRGTRIITDRGELHVMDIRSLDPTVEKPGSTEAHGNTDPSQELFLTPHKENKSLGIQVGPSIGEDFSAARDNVTSESDISVGVQVGPSLRELIIPDGNSVNEAFSPANGGIIAQDTVFQSRKTSQDAYPHPCPTQPGRSQPCTTQTGSIQPGSTQPGSIQPGIPVPDTLCPRESVTLGSLPVSEARSGSPTGEQALSSEEEEEAVRSKSLPALSLRSDPKMDVNPTDSGMSFPASEFDSTKEVNEDTKQGSKVQTTETTDADKKREMSRILGAEATVQAVSATERTRSAYSLSRENLSYRREHPYLTETGGRGGERSRGEAGGSRGGEGTSSGTQYTYNPAFHSTTYAPVFNTYNDNRTFIMYNININVSPGQQQQQQQPFKGPVMRR